MFDSHIIKQVITLWNRTCHNQIASPPFLVIKNIMETVFLAGLNREEGRPVQVVVSLINPSDYKHRGPSSESVLLTLETRQPFNVNTLVKLASAFDPTTTALAVSQVSEKGYSLEIWGAIFTSIRGGGRFDPLILPPSPPEVLTVSTKKTGALSLYRGSEVIARFHAGKFSEPIPSPFSSNLMGWGLLRGIRSHPEFNRNGMYYWDVYRDFLTHLLIEASNRGVGGAIIWLPEKIIKTAHQGILPRHTLAKSPEGVSLIEFLCQMEHHKKKCQDDCLHGRVTTNPSIIENTILECKRRLVEHAELLAQLTCIDGALILSSRLKPLSFGSILAAPNWEGNTMHSQDENDTNLYPINLVRYGTRHNSAVNFIGWNPNAVAFVISQDGPIAGLTYKDEETVYWWPDCLGKQRLPGHSEHSQG